jgi:aspartyl-tRNA(Asn)/glutamyl-tRNA(Gln) amidotransferase subunit C
MSISRNDVEHIAMLARMRLSDDELHRMTEQLAAILGHIAVLQEADTSDVPPSAATIPPIDHFREDLAAPSFPTDDLLANAPEHEEGYLRVKAVLE